MVPRIGEILVKRGLISGDQLENVLRLQSRRGGRLGPAVVALGYAVQTDIDDAWSSVVVVPALEDAIDRASGNRFRMQPDRRITFVRIDRRDTLVENMLSGCAVTCAQVEIQGQAVMHIGDAQCLPIDFSIDLEHGFALLDDNSESIVRRWVGIVERRLRERDAAAASPAS